MKPLAPFSAADRVAGAPMTAVVVEDVAKLTEHVPAWESLAGAALEPNVFHEPWMLLPALAAYGRGKKFRFLLLFTADPARPRSPFLCGFFPLECRRGYHQLPVSTLGLWQYPHCYLGTPLLRAEFARPALQAFFDWLASDPRGCALVELGLIAGDGPFSQLLVDELRERALVNFSAHCWTRALLRPTTSAEAYLESALSGSLRRTLKRKKKRLAETGELRCRSLTPDDDLATWLDDFLRLEASGWKGAHGTALASSVVDRAFFTSVAGAAFRRGRLAMLAMRLDGRPIACRCTFRAGAGAFSFKSAFAEDQATYSPGVLLEVENIHHAHGMPGLRWMDSCTSPDNAMINRLWQDRRTLQTMVVATGKGPGRLAVSILPLARWLKQALGRRFGRPNELATDPPNSKAPRAT